MSENKERSRDWIDISLRAATPLIVGLVIAWAGLFGDKTLSKISSRQESARLITELQIKREQAESELRKDIFAQALEAFLLKGRAPDGKLQPLSLRAMSKQLLRLELLALNFGDSLSLSPLFAEVRRDLNSADQTDDSDSGDFTAHRRELLKRLDSLAKRVASKQLSSLEKHGHTKRIRIPLYQYKALQVQGGKSCDVILFKDEDFAWPDREILRQMDIFDKNYKPVVDIESVNTSRDTKTYREFFDDASLIELQGIKRYIDIHVSNVEHCKNTARVQIIVRRKGIETEEVNREFRLDYFNFPMIDNTRLRDNHRFAIVAEDFKLDGDNPRIEMTAVVFPSEYASLRDRPGMEEARKLLESALRDEESDSN